MYPYGEPIRGQSIPVGVRDLEPEWFDSYRNAIDRVRELDQTRSDAHKQYLNLAGEVEARMVQEQLLQQDWSRAPWQLEGYTPRHEPNSSRS